jgi:hypothetical protein
MPDILKNQIKVMASEVMADTEDGGGQMTSVEVVSGNVNNAFPDSSRLDKTYGNVALRKVYLSVQTDTRATYYGSHVALVEQASDPLISVCLFTTEDWFDQRAACKNRVEGFLVKGPIYPSALWGDHYQGSKAVQLFVEENWELPREGEVLVLRVTETLDEQEIPAEEQFVRITDISSEIKTFTDNTGQPFTKKIVYLKFSDKLLFDMKGDVPAKGFAYSSDIPSTVYTSVSADTSKYYGVSKLAEPVTKSGLQIKVDEVRKPLVPSAQSQSSITDFGLAMSLPSVFNTSGNTVTKSIPHNNTKKFAVGFAVSRGSLQFSIGGNTWTDDSKGSILDSNKSIVGTLDYASGTLTFKETPFSGSGTAQITVKPAINYPTPTEAGSIEITEANRGFVYVFACNPIPKKGTLRIDFFSGGKWYSLYDKGTGEIKGLENGIGSGTINWDSGSVAMTLGGLPDVGSRILIYWGTEVLLHKLSDYNTGKISYLFNFALTEKSINHNTLEIPLSGNRKVYVKNFTEVWYKDEDNSVDVKAGEYIGFKGELSFAFPDGVAVSPTETFNAKYKKYSEADRITNAFNPTVGDSTLTGTLSGTDPILPRTVKGGFWVQTTGVSGGVSWEQKKPVSFYDDGNGKLLSDVVAGASKEIGTINYSNRQFTINKNVSITYNRVQYDSSTGTRRVYRVERKTSSFGYIPEGWGNPDRISYIPNIAGQTSFEESIQTTPKFKINKPADSTFVAGSLSFKCSGNDYLDMGTGDIKNISNDHVDFKVNYSTGELVPVFSSFTSGVTGLDGLMSYESQAGLYYWAFRCPGAPITPGSFTIKATKLDGSIITATAGMDGVIKAQDIWGKIDYTNGVVFVHFANWVLLEDHKEEEWTKTALKSEDGTEVLQYIKHPVQPSTIIMNCVVQTYVPLNEKLLGLNPVKLPIDGKVPMFRDGDIVLIHHTKKYVVANPSAGDVLNVRPKTGLIELYDNNGVYVPELNNYSTDKDAGKLTFEDPLDLASYAKPFQAIDRIEDMILATDVQITGHIKLSQPLQHSYAVDDAEPTFVSAVLPIGNLQSRIYNEFTDSGWNKKWLDARQFEPTTAQYDLVNYPIIVNNAGGVKERFACIFVSQNTVNVVGEHLGVIKSSASILADISPINPATGKPFFTIRKEGWGGGWKPGEVLRFNSDAANYPLWLCRTTQQGPATENEDEFILQLRGDSA